MTCTLSGGTAPIRSSSPDNVAPVASNAALFLDIDGTLIEFVPRPEEARVPPRVLAVLGSLCERLEGAVALVSGRALAEVDRMFAPLVLPAAGQHGAEARITRDGAADVYASPVPALAEVRDRARGFLAAHPAIRVEHKGLSTAFHYRGAESDAPALRAVLAAGVAAQEGALELLDSHLCFDVRARGANKGKVVERFMTVPPFSGRVPIYIGDDTTDEDGFAAALALNGRAIRVGAPRPTLATESLPNPQHLRDWLERSAQALAGGR